MEIASQQIDVRNGGETMCCHLARPAVEGTYPGLVVVMEAFGLNAHIKSITNRFAAEGFVAISPNLFFRQENNVVAYDDFQGAFRLMEPLTGDQILADMNAAIAYLKNLTGVGPNIGTTGFCMGGQAAFLTACRNSHLKAAVPFYGGGMVNSRHSGIRAPIEYVDGLNAPVLAFFGGKDPFIPVAEVDAFRERLKAAGKQAEIVMYADADHGFMCDERPSYHPTHAKEAWDKAIAFLKSQLS
jgi:carboxymethylenebutenolidase